MTAIDKWTGENIFEQICYVSCLKEETLLVFCGNNWHLTQEIF